MENIENKDMENIDIENIENIEDIFNDEYSNNSNMLFDKCNDYSDNDPCLYNNNDMIKCFYTELLFLYRKNKRCIKSIPSIEYFEELYQSLPTNLKSTTCIYNILYVLDAS
jgi:hypothetical protein